MDELNALLYLDYVIRETMRVHAPVPFAIRAAMKDDILPLNTPFTDKKGKVHDGIRHVSHFLLPWFWLTTFDSPGSPKARQSWSPYSL
jgi:hypothetical protein